MKTDPNDSRLDAFLRKLDVSDSQLDVLHDQIAADIQANDGWLVPCPEALRKNELVIHEHVRFLKARLAYDVCDPESGQILVTCREPRLGLLSAVARMYSSHAITNYTLEFKDWREEVLLTLRRDTSFLGIEKPSQIFNERGQSLGFLQPQSAFLTDDCGRIEDHRYKPLVSIRGRRRELQFTRATKTIAEVTRQWSGFLKEQFTDADTYTLRFHNDVPAEDPVRGVVLAAVIGLDIEMG